MSEDPQHETGTGSEEDRISQLESRLRRLEARDQVRHLKMRYAQLCDSGYPADELAELFLPDAVWDGGETLGRYEGQSAIREFYRNSSARVPWALHYTVAGDIEVDEAGERATATWYLWQPMIRKGEPTWLMGVYEDIYVRTMDGWRFAHVSLHAKRLVGVFEPWQNAGSESEEKMEEGP